MSSSYPEDRAELSPSSLPKFQKKIGNGDQAALNFGMPAENDDAMVRTAISRAIRNSSKSRDQIAEEMTTILGVHVTGSMLNDFTASAKRLCRWPAAWDRAFCAVTGDIDLLICRVRAAGFMVIGSVERDLMELGREYLRRKRADAATAELEQRLREVKL